MQRFVAILGQPESDLARQVASRLQERGITVGLLNLDAAHDGGAVSILPGGVLWEGFDLSRADAVLVERPDFAWPQPQRLAELIEDGAPSRPRIQAEREARSLTLSALEVASRTSRVINRPSSAHLAVSPALALSVLERGGVPVQPWRIEVLQNDGADNGRVALDIVGRDLWRAPVPPAAGEPALTIERPPGRISTWLVVGGSIAGALCHEDAARWIDGKPFEAPAAEQAATAGSETALRVSSVLELELVAVHIATAGTSPRVLLADAGPDIEEWNRALRGALVLTLSDHLAGICASREGVVS